MLDIAGIPIDLPPGFEFLGNIYVSLALTFFVWVAAAFLTYQLAFRLAKQLVRRIPGEADDAILNIIQRPLLAIVIIVGVVNTLRLIPFPGAMDLFLTRLRNAGIALMIVIAFWRLFQEVIIYYSALYAARSESNLDDVLLPVFRQIGSIVIAALGAFFVLQYLGLDLTGLWVAVGGAAFILAFALQDILSNIFSGIALIVDTPFKYGDLIELEDGTICRVERIGVRITELYNVANHTVIYMPNRALANERLLNITKPNTDLRITISLSVNHDSQPDEVIENLEAIANAHPNVLSPLPHKIDLLQARVEQIYDQVSRSLQTADVAYPAKKWRRVHYLIEEIARLEQEHRLNEEIDAFEEHLGHLADLIDQIEERGLSRREKLDIHERLARADGRVDEIARQATLWLMLVRYQMAWPVNGDANPEPLADIQARAGAYLAHVQSLLGAERGVPLLGSLPVVRRNDLTVKKEMRQLVRQRGFEGLDRGFRDLDIRQEFEDLVWAWNLKLHTLKEKLADLYDELRSGNERRLDDRVRQIGEWIHTSFKETTPDWKYPDVLFSNLEDSTLHFTVELQVDDISREHFDRRARVETELREEIWRAFGNGRLS